MGFSDRQTRLLNRAVSERHLRRRVRDGKELSYVEGWFAIAEANRIFGFDSWDRETVEAKCVFGRETRGNYTAVYTARVRLTVRANDRTIVREGHGTGEGRGSQPGDVHDLALKTAETDATKRALATFGRAFGLALYASPIATRGTTSDRSTQPDAKPATDLAKIGSSPSRSSTTDVDNRHEEECHESSEARCSGNISTAEKDGFAPSQVIAAPQRAIGIDKSVLALSEPRRVRHKAHLQYVASQPCLLCSSLPSDAHHVRFAQPRAMGRKVSDEYTVPLCRKHHRDLHHSGGEAAWWHDMRIDPMEIAKQLWAETSERH